jgi:carbon-monoxide dehydrogenase medium subunit
MTTLLWLEPTTLAEALALRQAYGDEARPLGGGVWVTLLLQQGLLRPRALLALHRLADLTGIGLEPDGTLRLGAGLPLNVVASHPLVRERAPVLARACGLVANVRIRAQGTIGGNLCEADYASDPPAALAALGARVRLASTRGTRELPVQEFLVGHYQTQVQPEEIVTDLLVPPPLPGARSVYLKFVTRSSEDRPCATVAAVAGLDAEGRCQHLALAVGAVASTPVVRPAVAALARGERLTPALIREIASRFVEGLDLVSDLRGSADYRRHLVRVLLQRALHQVAAAPEGGVRDGDR